MSAAVALRQEDSFATTAAASSRREVLDRYRRLREIGRQHHAKVLKFVSGDAIMHQASRLGLTQGRTLVLESMDELTLAFDLLIYTAPAGRSRAIDRYARSAQLAPGSDEVLMLVAMQQARFAVIGFERRHEAAGVIVQDMFRQTALWLVDEGLEMTVPDGALMATRLYTPDRFSMTAGVGTPVDVDLIETVFGEMPKLRRVPPAEISEDRRFAEAIYHAAVAEGLTEQMAFQDVPSA